MGRAEGEGRQKGRTSFFFYILHREGYLQAGVPPRATFRGPRVLRCLLPFFSRPPPPLSPKLGGRATGDGKKADISLLGEARASHI